MPLSAGMRRPQYTTIFMNNINKKEALLIGRTKSYLNAGYTLPEISKKLGVSEVTINAYKKIIDEAEKNSK